MIHFKNYHKQLPVPFVIYADFEAITKRYKVVNQLISHTLNAINPMKTVDSAVMMINTQNQFNIYRGENAVHNFMAEMLCEVKWCKKVIINNFNKLLKMTNEDERNFKKANKCHICDKKYKEDIRVRGHCYIIGKYR